MERCSLDPLRELRLVLWFRSLLVRQRIDVVHGIAIKRAIYGSLAARLARRPTRVNAVAGMGYVFTSNHMRARLLRPMVRQLPRLALDGPSARLILRIPMTWRCSVSVRPWHLEG